MKRVAFALVLLCGCSRPSLDTTPAPKLEADTASQVNASDARFAILEPGLRLSLDLGCLLDDRLGPHCQEPDVVESESCEEGESFVACASRMNTPAPQEAYPEHVLAWEGPGQRNRCVYIPDDGERGEIFCFALRSFEERRARELQEQAAWRDDTLLNLLRDAGSVFTVAKLKGQNTCLQWRAAIDGITRTASLERADASIELYPNEGRYKVSCQKRLRKSAHTPEDGWGVIGSASYCMMDIGSVLSHDEDAIRMEHTRFYRSEVACRDDMEAYGARSVRDEQTGAKGAE